MYKLYNGRQKLQTLPASVSESAVRLADQQANLNRRKEATLDGKY